MNDKMWRFVGNNYATETGLDTADMETFKKDPISSFHCHVNHLTI